jgi:cytochrome c biogenesis factor
MPSPPTRRRGIFILIFLVAVIGSSLALFAWRAPKVGLGGRFGLVSRESMLLTNNVLLVVACATVLLGTLYPLLIDALGVGKISVGPPYFNAVFVPVMAPVLFLMGVGPFARWKEASIAEILRTVRWAFVAACRGRHRPAADLRPVDRPDRARPPARRLGRRSPRCSISSSASSTRAPASLSSPPH